MRYNGNRDPQGLPEHSSYGSNVHGARMNAPVEETVKFSLLHWLASKLKSYQ